MSGRDQDRTRLAVALLVSSLGGACSHGQREKAPGVPAEASAPLVHEAGFFDVPGQPFAATYMSPRMYDGAHLRRTLCWSASKKGSWARNGYVHGYKVTEAIMNVVESVRGTRLSLANRRP
jgi:hypothetical protein